jgi:hypothetical protein
LEAVYGRKSGICPSSGFLKYQNWGEGNTKIYQIFTKKLNFLKYSFIFITLGPPVKTFLSGLNVGLEGTFLAVSPHPARE